MYLLDTNVVSEARKGPRADAGVITFLTLARQKNEALYLTALQIGELRQGVERLRRRGDAAQAKRLAEWMNKVVREFHDEILPFDAEAGQIWGALCAIDPSHVVDKQVAAIALLHDLTVVTRNTADFERTGVRLHNPFHASV